MDFKDYYIMFESNRDNTRVSGRKYTSGKIFFEYLKQWDVDKEEV